MMILDVFRGKDGFWVFIGCIGFGIILCVLALALLFGVAVLWGL